jgi:hypothetical protein
MAQSKRDKAMTNNEINKIISDELGVSDFQDFCNDFNAINKAKQTLNLHQQTDYVRNLMLQNKEFPMTDAFFATARQQAEAFLKTVGKWKEAKP